MTVNPSFLLDGVPGRQIDLVDKDASKMLVHIWRLRDIPKLVLALLRKKFTSIQNFDQLGVLLGRKRPSV